MSNADSNEQFDADTEQRKADILRARDIIPGSPKRDEGRLGTPPPYKNVTGQEPDSQQTGQNEPRSPTVPEASLGEGVDHADVPQRRLEAIKPTEDIAAAPTEPEQQKSEIPKFDLAAEIMAEQRRITAIRRKAPGQKDEAQRQEREAESADYIIGQRSPALSEQEQIIAEIVARDIEKLCRGGSSSLRNW